MKGDNGVEREEDEFMITTTPTSTSISRGTVALTSDATVHRTNNGECRVVWHVPKPGPTVGQ
jgi:hypothetical protein